MPADEPGWWYTDDRRARLLAPIARIWARAAEQRYRERLPYKSRLSVICVGNFTAGGTGKTPVSLLVAELLRAAGEHPVFLTRGYGGRITGPAWLDRERHTARDTGDEPLLLARQAPVMIARDRAAGARLIETSAPPGGHPPPSVIVMDDGLQNPALAKDLTIALVDGGRGVGNGLVMPAGPLRAPLEFQLGLVDAVIVVGGADAPVPGASGAVETPASSPVVTSPPSADDGLGPSADGGEVRAGGSDDAASAGRREAPPPAVLRSLRLSFPGPVLSARQEPADDTAWLRGSRVVAYAGIGNPERFFSLLRRLGADVVEAITFRDHQPIGERDAARLLARAASAGAALVTTEKDLARMAGAAALAPLRDASCALPIRIALPEADAARLADLVMTAARTGGYKRGLKR